LRDKSKSFQGQLLKWWLKSVWFVKKDSRLQEQE